MAWLGEAPPKLFPPPPLPGPDPRVELKIAKLPVLGDDAESRRLALAGRLGVEVDHVVARIRIGAAIRHAVD